MNLKETKIRRLRTVHGRAVNFFIDEVRLPNRRKAVREFLDHPGAVAVIPLLGKDRIVMVGQYRYPVGQITWEIPAGKLDRGEAPLSCVRRELSEETGYRARTVKKLISFWPTPAFGNEVIHIYTATGLTPGDVHPDSDEFLTTAVWPIKKALREIRAGRIKDSKTVIAFLAYAQFHRH